MEDLWVYALAALVVVPSPLLMFLSSEAIAVALALQGRPPLAVALALALGQLAGFTLLFIFGESLCERSARLRALRARLDVERFRPRATPLFATAALLGLPPLNLSTLAAAAVGLPLRRVALLTLCGRTARYWAVASAPGAFAARLDLSWLPTWLAPP
ncbi:MAG: hypothetical protein FJ138_15605 [Deltaproteobacteria bacterium]|nr:hypothetical protein [Deltaproteobacteria bacterium]